MSPPTISDAESVAWLEHFLEEYPSTVVAVTHDRYFLDNVAEWILELDRGHGIPWQGNYSSWLEQKEQRLAQEERQQDALAKTLKRELEWVRTNPKARQAKSKARLQRFEELSSQEFQKRNETNEIYIPPGDRLGDLVIECKGLRKGYGDRLLIESLSFNLPAGGIVGIIGPNGAGKTTLFRMLAGMEKPDAGEIRVGPTVKLAYVDQSRQALNDKNTVWQEISGGLDLIKVGNYETSSRSYVGRFNFKGVQQQQFIGDLSGGERNRVHLAKVLKSGGNVLLLDEPTNDLDIETLRALEEALVAFPGCAVVISHDRWFLDRIATHILAFEGDSQVVWFEGNYQEYVEDLQAPQRRGRRPAASDPLQTTDGMNHEHLHHAPGRTARRVPGHRPDLPALPHLDASDADRRAEIRGLEPPQAQADRHGVPLRCVRRAGIPEIRRAKLHGASHRALPELHRGRARPREFPAHLSCRPKPKGCSRRRWAATRRASSTRSARWSGARRNRCFASSANAANSSCSTPCRKSALWPSSTMTSLPTCAACCSAATGSAGRISRGSTGERRSTARGHARPLVSDLRAQGAAGAGGEPATGRDHAAHRHRRRESRAQLIARTQGPETGPSAQKYPRVAEQAHPGAVLAPFTGGPGVLHGAEHPLGMRHDGGDAPVGRAHARHARG